MAKRVFFYTDSVAALWMVRAHRLKLQAGTFCLQPESADAFLDMLAKGVRPERLVVLADSVAVLEPKLGDVVEETANGKTKVKRLAAKDFPLTGSRYDIIQRGGRPFFMPDRAGE